MTRWPKAGTALVCLLTLGASAWSVRAMASDADGVIDIRALPLTDQDGRATSLHAFDGQTLVLHFIFTHCVSACHLQVKSLRTVRDALPAEIRSRVQFVSVSLDPEHDTPAVLRRYADMNEIVDAQWRFVTASPDVVERITKHFAVTREAVADGQINHTLAVFLFDAGGRMIQRYADPVDTTRLVNEISDVDKLSSAQRSH
jgi:cytochrome oxidase Cu insertion factor (SCO1/SenC/PrrC family)